MRKIGCLIVLVVAMPLASWASGSMNFESFHGKSLSGSALISSRWSGSDTHAGALFGKSALTTSHFDDSSFKGGFWVEADKDHGGPLLGGKRHCLGCDRSKGGDDDGGGDDGGGKIALPVPEPGTLSLLGAGLVGLAGIIRRRRHA